MCIATRAFLVLAVLFWLIAAPPATAVPGEGVGPPDHGNRGQGNGKSHGNGSQGHGNGNRGDGTGNQGNGNQNQGRNGNGGGGGRGDTGGGSGAAACGAEAGDADALAGVRAMVADQCDCASASNHGHYVKCVAQVANAAVRNGSLRSACHDSVVHCAAMSTCGKKSSVTCCRTDSQGTTQCSIKHRAAACRASRGGTACVGTVSSCCDACPAGTCPSSPSGAFVGFSDGLLW